MAFLGGLFDAFTGSSAKEAAAKNAELYRQYGQQSAGLLGQAGGLYRDFGQLGDQYLTQYGGQAQGALRGGLAPAEAQFGEAKTAAQGGIDAFRPLSNLAGKYGGATDLYLGALGVNGPAGTAAAKSAFTTGPGYEFAVNEATNAAARNAAKLGLAGSGNALDEIRSRAQGVAGQEYGNYLNRLAGFVNPELAATSGAAQGTAAGFRNLGDLSAQQAGLYPALGAREAELFTGLGTARTGLAGQVAGGQAGLLGNQVNVLGNVAGGQASANTAAAQAAQNASMNFWNTLASLGGTAAKIYTGGAGAGVGAR